MRDLTRSVDEIVADFHAGRADADPYDEIAALVAEVERLRLEVIGAETTRYGVEADMETLEQRFQNQMDAATEFLAENERLRAELSEWERLHPEPADPPTLCPVHGMRDCSPLLNGCSGVTA